MENLLTVPAPIKERLPALNALVEKYPRDIPLKECASFLGLGHDSLRRSIETGNCPFALGWKQEGRANRAFLIPTTPFYLWYTQCACFRTI